MQVKKESVGNVMLKTQKKKINLKHRGDLDLEVQIEKLENKIEILEKENERLDEENKNIKIIVDKWKEERAGSAKDPALKGD
jgi:chaperonin cofactor prefoldin